MKKMLKDYQKGYTMLLGRIHEIRQEMREDGSLGHKELEQMEARINLLQTECTEMGRIIRLLQERLKGERV